MRAVIERDKLLKILNRVQAVADRKSSMAILSTVLVEGRENVLSLSATDLEIGYRGEVPVELEGEGAFCLPARKFYEIVRNFPRETLILEGELEGGVQIRDLDQDITYRLSVFAPEDFPSLPDISGETVVEVPGETLEDMLEKTLYAAATDEARYALSGILVTREGENLRLVATDGHRLSLVDREVPGVEVLPLEEGVIVPRKAAQEIKRMASEEVVLRLGIQDHHFVVSSSEGVLLARLIEGQFPDYRAVIPRDPGRRVLVHRERLTEALKRVSLLASDKYRVVRFDFAPGEVVLTGSGGELGEARERLPLSYEGDPFTINFNARYLLDVFNVMESEEVELDIGSERTPCRITGPEDPGFLALVMPMAV